MTHLVEHHIIPAIQRVDKLVLHEESRAVDIAVAKDHQRPEEDDVEGNLPQDVVHLQLLHALLTDAL